MSGEPRLSTQTLKVLGILMAGPQTELSGAEIGRATNLASGTLYPILLRLEQAQWLKSRWEAGDPKALGRPRRRFYRVTALGSRRVEAAFKELKPALEGLSWI